MVGDALLTRTPPANSSVSKSLGTGLIVRSSCAGRVRPPGRATGVPAMEVRPGDLAAAPRQCGVWRAAPLPSAKVHCRLERWWEPLVHLRPKGWGALVEERVKQSPPVAASATAIRPPTRGPWL